MKKFLKILLVVCGILFLAILFLPFAFRGKIESKVKAVINENINASVNWDKFSLSLIRSFPNLGIGLDGFTVVNNYPFEGETLVSVGRFYLSVDLMKAIRGQAIDVRSILVDKPEINLMVNSDSIANWSIMPVAEVQEEAPVDTVPATFNIGLRSLEIRDAALSFIDATMDFATGVKGFEARMSGDFSETHTTINLRANVDTLDVILGGTQYVRNAPLSLNATLAADLEQMIFTFEENELVFSNVPLFFEGYVDMLDEGYQMDLKLAARNTDFKTLLALVPEVFMKDFAGLRADGTMSLEATAKGVFIDSENLPAFNLALSVDGGRIQYPDLPKSIDDIRVRMHVENPGGTLDNTVVDISDFGFTLDDNPFNASLHLSKPISNATFNGAMNGTVNLTSLASALPMDTVELGGIIKLNLLLAGDLQMIENKAYESIKAEGTVILNNFAFSSPALPMGVTISSADLFLSPRFLELRGFSSRLGESDFNLTGRLENYLAYFLQDGVISGRLNHTSNFINANELMGLTGEAAPEDTVVQEPIGKILIPGDIAFDVTTNVNSLLFNQLTLSEIAGNLQIIDSRVLLNGLRTNLLNGRVVMNGEYDTRDTLKPAINFNLGIEDIDINSAANSVNMVNAFMPVARNTSGRVSSTLSFSSIIGDGLTPLLSSFNGRGSLRSNNLEVAGTRAQTALVSMLNDERYKIAGIRDLLVNFSIENGNLMVNPFDVEVFGKRANVSGTQSLDQNMNFLITMPVSREEVGRITGGLLGGTLPTGGQDVMVGINITGKPTDPKLALDVRALGSTIREEARAKVQAEAEKAVDKAIEEAGRVVVEEVIQNEEVKQQIDEGLRRLRDRLR